MIDPDSCAQWRARFRAPATLLVAFFLAMSLSAPPAAHARKLAVDKYPAAWDALRGAPGSDGTERISRTSSWVSLKGQLPESARHGHLHFGKPAPSLFQSPRAAELRGGTLDTLVVRIAILRMEFDADRKGSLTTGDGHFLQENPDPNGIFIDPAPHDDRYFRAHLEAVSRYWSSITYGHVRFEGDVFPRGQRFGAYHLTDMADYGPRNDQEPFSIEGLTNYSREALMAADADPDLVWSDYDVIFVAHAGADWQNDILQDTPFDLPSFSITLSDSQVVVADEGDTLTTMITHPESSSQDGFQVALNAVVAHEMGHQLGLLDLYDVETFAPTVAFYDVMDSGTNISVFVPSPANPDSLVEVIGVLPSAVGAWNRWLVTFPFGIEPPEVKEDLPRAGLRAIQARGELPPGMARWYRVPMSDTEYFLVENRVDDLDGQTNGVYNTALDQDDSTGVVLGPIVGDSDPPLISHNYDLLIDPGVLIWHVDERQALAFLSQGRGINVDFLKRSVTIEEADGLVDIGSPFSPFPLGTDREAFWAGNNSNFTPTSRPNSDSNLGSPSGISITNIGPRGLDVTMDIGFTSKPRGWPMRVGAYGTSGRTSTTAADVDGDGIYEIASLGESAAYEFRYDDRDLDGEVDVPAGWSLTGQPLRGVPAFTQTLGDLDGDHRLELLCGTDSGFVYAFGSNGLPFGGADSTGILFDYGIDARPSWPPTPADLDGDGVDELYVAGEDARLRGYDVPLSGPPVERFTPRPLPDLATADSTDVLSSTLAFGDVNDDGLLDGLVSFVHGDSLYLQRFAADGRRTLRATYLLPEDAGASATERVWMGLADLDRKAGATDLEIVLALESGWVLVVSPLGEVQSGWPLKLSGRASGPPAFGDVDGDGLLEIVLSGGVEVHALNYNGTEMPGWPALPRLVDYPGDPQPTGPAAIADVDGDGSLDVVCGFVDFTVRALGADGREIAGFAIPTGAPLHTSPVILDANADGRLDLFVQTGDGHVYGKILGGLASDANPAWPMFAGGHRLHGAYDSSRLPIARNGPSSVLAGKVVIFPNPVRDAETFRVRYTLGPGLDASTQVDVTLYNVAGEKVRSAKGTTFANTENVVTLSSADLASGVYLCTLRARSGTREETARDRIAVIR